MPRIPLPIQEAIRDFLGDLLGRGVAVGKCEVMEIGLTEAPPVPEGAEVDEGPEPVGPQTLAVYADDAGRPVAAAVCDLDLGGAAGAALALVPPVMLEEVRKARELPDNLAENLHEILNIFSSLLNSSTTPHLVLKDTVVLPAELPPEVVQVLTEPERRRDFVVTIEGYGDGRMAVMAIPA